MIKRSLSAHERWRVPLVLLCLASRTASYTLQRDDDADGLLPDDVGLLTSNASGRPSWAEHILNLAQPSAHAARCDADGFCMGFRVGGRRRRRRGRQQCQDRALVHKRRVRRRIIIDQDAAALRSPDCLGRRADGFREQR